MQYLFDVCAVSWLHLGRIFWSQVALAHKTIYLYQYALRDVYKMSLAFSVFFEPLFDYVYRILIVGIVAAIVQLMLTLENTTELKYCKGRYGSFRLRAGKSEILENTYHT